MTVIEIGTPEQHDAADRAYRESFAFWSPIMRARWTSRASTAESRRVALDDIAETLSIWEGGVPDCSASAYVGKLYAERDAILDRTNAPNRKPAKRAA